MSASPQTYIGALLVRTFQPSVRITDAVSIILSTGAPFAYRVIGAPMPDNTIELVGVWAAAAAIAIIGLRLLIFAPFSIWADEAKGKAALHDELSSPDFIIRKSIAKEHAKLRQLLSKEIADLSLMSGFKLVWQIDTGSGWADEVDRYDRARQTAMHLSERLLYRPELRNKCHLAIQACDDYISSIRDTRSGDPDIWFKKNTAVADALRALN